MDNGQSNEESIREAIKRIAGTWEKPIAEILFAIVDSVDVAARTCNVTPITGSSSTPIEDVALSIDRNDGEIKIPSINSTVGVAISNQIDAFVFAWSDLDQIVLNGGNFDGLVKVRDLASKLNSLENDLNTIKQAFSSWVVIPNDGGAALKTIASLWASQTITITQQADLENTSIKHGNS